MATRKKRSGIKINPAHRGAFTRKAKAAGMGVQSFARIVLAKKNKSKYSASTRKQANFARNQRKFKRGGRRK